MKAHDEFNIYRLKKASVVRRKYRDEDNRVAVPWVAGDPEVAGCGGRNSHYQKPRPGEL